MKTLSTENPHANERWVLLRDIGVVQAKLIIDGLRDLVLVPATLIAGIVSLVNSKDGHPGSQFYQMLAFGKQTEHWINLFGAVENSPEKLQQRQRFGDGDIDDLLGKFESFLIDEAKHGGITTQAKKHLDRILDAVQRRK
ncbi:MAG: hypothetical protein IIB75_05080 [Proteobacteria bacterium]|nr:hypothetical protein [Pseudomonadota bacterium]